MASSSNSIGEESDHVIQIWQVNRDRLANMQQKLSDTKISPHSKFSAHSCIFRVGGNLVEANGRAAYQPQLAAIGPYHHGEPRLRPMENHKWRYLASLLDRTQSKGLGLEDYLKAIHPLEMKARECYSETTPLSTDEFLEVLVLDGCFLIELFRRVGSVVPIEPNDLLISMRSMFCSLLSDFIRLENQIPFFILQRLFDMSIMPGQEHGPSLTQLVLESFNYAFSRPSATIERYRNLEGRHLLDILRLSFLPLDSLEPKKPNFNTCIINCVSKLRLAGMKFRGTFSDSFLTVRFRHGVLEIPTIMVDDFMRCFITNCVAFEQYQWDCSTHFTAYATFLDCLINTSKDVEFLCDCNVIENCMGSDAEVAEFVNKLGKDVVFDIQECYLSELFDEVNEYYTNQWHEVWTDFRKTYFSSRWWCLSILGALILLCLTVMQTLYTMLGYYRPT